MLLYKFRGWHEHYAHCKIEDLINIRNRFATRRKIPGRDVRGDIFCRLRPPLVSSSPVAHSPRPWFWLPPPAFLPFLSLHPHPILNWFSRDRREQASARIGSPVIDRFATAAAFRSFVRREIPPLRRRFSRWESWLRNYASVSTWHAVSSADSFHSSVFSSEIPLHEIVGRSGRRVTSRHVAVISPRSCRRGCTLQLNHAINFPMFTHFPVRNTR